MHRRTIVVLAFTAPLAVASMATAAKPPKPPKPPKPTPAPAAVSLSAAATSLTFPRTTVLSGQLTGNSAGGVSVRLERDNVPPLGDHFTRVGSAMTAADGTFRFPVAPASSTRYRVVVKSSPAVTSAAVLIGVRPLVGLSAPRSVARRGARALFSGSVRPAHTGLLVKVQRRTSTGRWATVARATLKDSGVAGRSSFSRRVAIPSGARYRVVLPAHADHRTGTSRSRLVRVR